MFFNINKCLLKLGLFANLKLHRQLILTTNNLNPGKYIVTAIYEGYDVGNNVVVKSVLLTDDLSMKFKDGSKFNATVLDGQGKPLANQTVIFNVNGVFYNKTTADNGVASLNIRLLRGEYIITSIWNSYQIGNKITIR